MLACRFTTRFVPPIMSACQPALMSWRQPVGFRLSYAHRHIPGDGAENFEDLTFRLVRSRLADHFRARAGYLEETAAAASVNRGLVVPSLFKETDGRLTWKCVLSCLTASSRY